MKLQRILIPILIESSETAFFVDDVMACPGNGRMKESICVALKSSFSVPVGTLFHEESTF